MKSKSVAVMAGCGRMEWYITKIAGSAKIKTGISTQEIYSFTFSIMTTKKRTKKRKKNAKITKKKKRNRG